MISSSVQGRYRGVAWFVLLRVPEILLAVLVAALVIFLAFSVFARYVLDMGLAWSDEAARLLFVWLVFLGFAVGLKYRGNIGVELLVDRLPGSWKRGIGLMQDLAILLFSVVFLWQSAIAVKFSFMQRLPALQISIAWMYFSVLVASALMTIYAVTNVVESLRGESESSIKGEDAARRAS